MFTVWEWTITPTWIPTAFSYFNCSGSLWNEPSAKSCVGQKQPVFGSTYPGGLPPADAMLKSVLSKITKPVTLLDITPLSLLRKDGHPSIYGLLGGPTALDCSHWCLAGVPDTWNEILYNLILCNRFLEISIENLIHFFAIIRSSLQACEMSWFLKMNWMWLNQYNWEHINVLWTYSLVGHDTPFFFGLCPKLK